MKFQVSAPLNEPCMPWPSWSTVSAISRTPHRLATDRVQGTEANDNHGVRSERAACKRDVAECQCAEGNLPSLLSTKMPLT